MSGWSLVLVALLLLAGCGGDDGARLTEPDGVFAVADETITVVDPSRPTAANGGAPGSDARLLRTAVFHPLAAGRFPLIVFAHGLGALGRIYTVILSAWAAEGYVVAAPDFPLSRATAPGGPARADYVNQPADLSFLIDTLLALDADPTSALHGRIDAAHVGAAGQSLGGLTTFGLTLDTCCRDPRIDAAVPMAGLLAPFPGGVYDGAIAPPTLVIHGDADDTVPYDEARTAYDLLRAPKALLTHLGGGHILPYVGSSDRAAQQATIDASIAFFDLYLKHERGARERLLAVGTRERVRLEADL
jgi:predicted dienelactone hydrolase